MQPLLSLIQLLAALSAQVARVREAAAEARVREGMQAARLKLSLLQRLQRADHSRWGALHRRRAGMHKPGGPSCLRFWEAGKQLASDTH